MKHKQTYFFIYLFFLSSVFLFFLILSKEFVNTSDFAYWEWMYQVSSWENSGLPYNYSFEDPMFRLVPIPDQFFAVHAGSVTSTFPHIFIIIAKCFLLGLPVFYYKYISLLFLICSFIVLKYVFESELMVVFTSLTSLLPIYIFGFHETTFIFLIFSITILGFKKDLHLLTFFLITLILILRPEYLAPLVLIPLYFQKTIQKQKIFYLTILSSILLILFVQFVLTGNILPLRIQKNSTLLYKSQVFLYLFKLIVTQIPAFTILALCLLFASIHPLQKRLNIFQANRLRILILFISIFLILVISPNSGGQNTPRYFFGFLPFLCFEIIQFNLNRKFNFIILGILIIFFSIQFHIAFRNLKVLSTYQKNLISTLRREPGSIMVFKNPDFSFAALPLHILHQQHFLLRSEGDLKILEKIARSSGLKIIYFADFLPNSDLSPYKKEPFAKCKTDCQWKVLDLMEPKDSLLPIYIQVLKINS